MEILNILVAQILAENLPRFTIEELEPLVKMKCMIILQSICDVVANHKLDDPTCFESVEAIVEILEENNIDCGGRHDFG